MIGYLLRRVAQSVIVIFGVTIAIFILQNLVASGPALARVVIGHGATMAQIHAFVVEHGLDKPFPVQYGKFLWQLLHGDLGYSYKMNEPVDAILAQDLPKDAMLLGPSLVLSLGMAIPIGLVQAFRRNRAFDYVATTAAFVLYAMPYFLIGLLLIAGFAVTLNLLPAEAPQGATLSALLVQPQAMILPILTLSLGNFAIFSRYMRSSAVESLTQDYIRTARAKGLSEASVLRRHVLRNSLIPVVTMVGLSVPAVLTAGFVVEFVFNFPGIGFEFYKAAVTSDYPVELGITLVISAVTVLGNLAADVAYAVLDPRVRYA